VAKTQAIISSHAGLTAAEAAERLRLHGPNILTGRKHFRPLMAFIGKFNSPIIWIIIAVAGFSFATGERLNAMILIAMIFLSVILDFMNTYRSETATRLLVGRVKSAVVVVRDGRQQEIAPEQIVPGDLVVLTAGNIVPADGYVIEEKDLYVNESALTGESLPVMKSIGGEDRPDTVDRQRSDAVLMGTSVISGYAVMLVITTGARTAYGTVAARLQVTAEPTDFEKQLSSFSKFLLKVTTIMVVAVFLLNFFGHKGLFESLLFAIAVAIGLTPELLPVILTVSLSRGAMRMAKQQVIVKHLPAIQTFGRMDVICTDKTGTLTQNKITVVRYIDADGQSSEEVLRYGYWSSRFHTGVFEPLDLAIASSRDWEMTGVEKIDEVPFDYERRRDSMVVNDHGRFELITKGAPEAVLSMCSAIRHQGAAVPLTTEERAKMMQAYDRLSEEGYKILGLAVKNIPTVRRIYEPADEESAIFYGFIALMDPPKESAREAIDGLEQLGIKVKILTGDSPVLTAKICREVDVPVTGVITGGELAVLSETDWPAVVKNNTIFARVDPMQKEKIINALKRGGAVVGFMGDGINDAPALKAADVGVSVDNAVDVAKETADIILLRHSLRVLRDGVIEGRRTFQNTMKYILMGLSSNFGNMLSMVVASAFLPFLPMLPTQILLNNFLYDSSQLALSTDNVDNADIKRPAVWDLRSVRKFMIMFGPVSSIFDILTFVMLLVVFRLPAADFQTGWFIESLATQVLVIYFIRTRRIPFLQSRPAKWLVINTLVMVTIGWLIPFTPIGQRIFGFAALKPGIVLVVFAIMLVYLVLIELVKHWFYHRAKNKVQLPPPVLPTPAKI
jgi:Mg2+-importing ATPase